MDKITQYQKIIQQLLQQYASIASSDSEVETQLAFDTELHHYQLLHVGWRNERRIYGCFLHLDIKDNKIWLQHNGTENEVTEDLVNMGVPRQDIVIGFHSQFKRQFTEYAVG